MPTSGVLYELTWWQKDLPQDITDEARMGIGFYDIGGALIGAITWAPYAVLNVWTERSVSALSPDGTSAVRIFMDMLRHTGSDNDGYIDDISLTADGAPIALTNPGAETGNTTGWTNTLGGIAVFSDGGHTGAHYFYGGAFAQSTAYQQIVAVEPAAARRRNMSFHP